jgi:hypothetical protein
VSDITPGLSGFEFALSGGFGRWAGWKPPPSWELIQHEVERLAVGTIRTIVAPQSQSPAPMRLFIKRSGGINHMPLGAFYLHGAIDSSHPMERLLDVRRPNKG